MRGSSNLFQVLISFTNKVKLPWESVTESEIFCQNLEQFTLTKGYFPKVAFLRDLQKDQSAASFAERLVLNLLGIKIWQMQFLGILFEVLLKVITETFPK